MNFDANRKKGMGRKNKSKTKLKSKSKPTLNTYQDRTAHSYSNSNLATSPPP